MPSFVALIEAQLVLQQGSNCQIQGFLRRREFSIEVFRHSVFYQSFGNKCGICEKDRRLTDRLKEMNNRTYLWLFLTVDIITGSRSKYSKVSDIDSLLSDLPSKVSDAYERILSRSSDNVRARILLQLIVAATRPLSLQEANIALTLATQKGNCTSHRKLDLWPLDGFKSTIQNICGLFVSVHDGKVRQGVTVTRTGLKSQRTTNGD